MDETYLVPRQTIVNAKGDGPVIDVSGDGNRIFLLVLEITQIIEQESLELGIFGSADGSAWGVKPLVSYPQKFYCGEYSFLFDLSTHPDVKFIRAHWDVARWGRGSETPMFEFGVSMKEIPADVLREVRPGAAV